jgi:hypothetical protein
MPIQLQRRDGGIDLTHLQPRHENGIGGEHHGLVALPQERSGIRCTRGRFGLGAELDGQVQSYPRRDSIP